MGAPRMDGLPEDSLEWDVGRPVGRERFWEEEEDGLTDEEINDLKRFYAGLDLAEDDQELDSPEEEDKDEFGWY